jgi:hypothetical protein
MSTAQGPLRGRRPATPVTLLRAASASYLVQFLVFVALLLVVVVLLARQPEGCSCGQETAQVLLNAGAGALALVGTVLLASVTARRERTGAVLLGSAVVLLAASGLVRLW